MSKDIQILNKGGDFAQGNHDIVFDGIGRLVMLTGRDKLIQDIQKILFTIRNNFYNDYSTDLDELIGTNLGKDQTINTLAQKITDSLVYLQFLQEHQAKYQQVLASEIIQTIVAINVDYLYELTGNIVDVRTFTAGIVIQSADGNVVNVTNNITLV